MDRGKRGIERPMAVDANGASLWAPSGAGRPPRLPALGRDAGDPAGARGFVRADHGASRPRPRFGGHARTPEGSWPAPAISEKGKPARLQAKKRRVVERTNSWNNTHKELLWCTERRGRVVDFWVAFSEGVIVVRRLIGEAWTRYRWEGRPSRRP